MLGHQLWERFRSRLLSAHPSIAVRYGAAMLAMSAIAMVRYAVFADFPAWFLYIPATIVITLFLGGGAGVLAASIATGIAGYALLQVDPIGRLSTMQAVATTVFGVTNFGLAGLAVSLRRAHIATEQMRLELTKTSSAAAAREAFLESVLASSTDCIKVLDFDGRLAFMSDGGQRVMDVSDFNDIEGCPWQDFWTGQGNTQAVAAIKAARKGRPSTFIGRAATMQGNPRWWHVAVSPIPGPDGQPERILSVSRDITALRESEQERDRFLRLAEASTDFIGMATVEGRVFFMNDAARKMVGLESADITQLTITDFFPPDQVATIKDDVLPAVGREGHWAGELSFRHFETGELIPVLYSVFPVTDADGQLFGYGTVTRDFRARKRAEEHLQMMNGELAHRLKNVLAVVQSVAQQTLRNASDTRAASRDLSSRLAALGTATDVLTGASWRSADLRDLIARSLAPHGQLGRQILLDGPTISLQPQVAVALALALHELATNAAKYGALSNESGTVVLTWRIDGSGPDARFHLSWREHGGPPVVAPARRGFGSTLIERSLRSYFGGTASTDYRPDGLVFTMNAELNKAALLTGEA